MPATTQNTSPRTETALATIDLNAKTRVAKDQAGSAPSPNSSEGLLPKSLERSAAEIRAVLDKLRLLAEAYAPYPDIKIRTGRGCGWSCALPGDGIPEIEKYVKGEVDSLDHLNPEHLRPRIINTDLDDIRNWPESRIIGVQSHEIGHAKHTDYRLFLRGQREALQGGNLPSSWVGIFNALEDPWINNREIFESDPRGAAIQDLYNHWIELHQSGVEKSSLLSQLGLNTIHYWATGKNIPTLTDTRVLDAWEAIKPAAEKYFNSRTAQENFDLLQREIWPIARQLEEKSQDDQLLKDLSKRLGGDSQNGAGQNEGELGAGTTKEGAAKGIFKRIKDVVFGDPKARQEQNEKREDKRLTEAAKDAAKRAGISSPPQTVKFGKPIAPDEEKKLRKVLDQLRPEDRKRLEDLARQAIDKEQVEFQGETFGNPIPLKKDLKDGIYKPKDTPETAEQDKEGSQDLTDAIHELEGKLKEAQAREDAEAERKRAEDAARLAKEIRDSDMRQDGFTPDDPEEEELFDTYRQLEGSISSYIAPFIKSLSALLPKERQLAFDGAFYSGKKLDAREVPRRAPVKDYKLYKRPTVEESPRPKMFIELLIDNTGSMAGDKMRESLRAAIFWGKVLEVLEIPFAIKLFGTSVESIKEFDQSMSDPRSRIKFNLLKKADASMYSTNIGDGLLAAKNEMVEKRRVFKDSLGAIFVFSDSGANSGLIGDALAQEVQQIAQRFALTNFMLTGAKHEIDEAKRIFGERNVVAPADFTTLCPESIRILRGTLDSFRRKLKL